MVEKARREKLNFKANFENFTYVMKNVMSISPMRMVDNSSDKGDASSNVVDEGGDKLSSRSDRSIRRC